MSNYEIIHNLSKFRVTDQVIKDELSKRLQKLHDNYKEDLEVC